jgi:predicted kinase
MTPALIVVTGPPASGKTTVARALARELRIPYVSKDTLKETLYEEIGSAEELEPKLERAALALLFAAVEDQLEEGVSVVAESNFDSDSDVGPFRRLTAEHDMRLIQVHTMRPKERLLERFAERAASGRRHPGHGDHPKDVDEVRARLEAGDWDPLDLPGELLEFELGDDADNDAPAIAERVRATLHGEA